MSSRGADLALGGELLLGVRPDEIENSFRVPGGLIWTLSEKMYIFSKID